MKSLEQISKEAKIYWDSQKPLNYTNPNCFHEMKMTLREQVEAKMMLEDFRATLRSYGIEPSI